MKKKYIIPEMEAVEIKSQQILAGSPTLTSSEWDSTSPILGREFDDEE